MPKKRMIGFCVLFVLFAPSGATSSEQSISLNHYKCFKGKDYPGEYIEANLVTPQRTRVQIMVTQLGEILESHRLVVGPKGVAEGKFKGAQSWGYRLPADIQEKDLDVDIFVLPLAGRGAPVSYKIRTLSAEDTSGFHYNSAVIH